MAMFGKRRLAVVTLLLSTLAVFSFVENRAANEKSRQRHRQDVEAWIEGREGRLKAPDGYLSIVGLYWLADGKNTFGSDPSNDLVFPDRAPPSIGFFDLRDGVLTAHINSDVTVIHDGEPTTRLALRDDTDDDGPSILQLGTLSWYVIKRGDRFLIRLKDTESALLKNLKTISRFPIDERWRIEGKLEEHAPDKYVALANTIGITTYERVYGTVVFELDGQTYKLDALGGPAAKSLFIIFADGTSGVETYGAGRYTYIDPPAKDGTVVIDFNKAYNPPCAFNEYTTCSLPPPQNLLPFRVTAGEKTYGKHGE